MIVIHLIVIITIHGYEQNSGQRIMGQLTPKGFHKGAFMLSFEWNYELPDLDKSIPSRASIMNRINSVWWEYRLDMCMGEWWDWEDLCMLDQGSELNLIDTVG